MGDFQVEVLDRLARVIGGTVSVNDPHFFSGALANGGAGDGTGVAGLTGCYSEAPFDIQAPPVGILIPARFDAKLQAADLEPNVDEVELLIMLGTADTESSMGQLASFRDSVPDAIRTHRRAYNMPNLGFAFINHGERVTHPWGGTDYFAWLFTITVKRDMTVAYDVGPSS